MDESWEWKKIYQIEWNGPGWYTPIVEYGIWSIVYDQENHEDVLYDLPVAYFDSPEQFYNRTGKSDS